MNRYPNELLLHMTISKLLHPSEQMTEPGNMSVASKSENTSTALTPLKAASQPDLEAHKENIQRLYQRHNLEDVQKIMKNEEGIYARYSSPASH